MALLSNLFGGDNSSTENTSADQSDFTSDFDAVLDVNYSTDSSERWSDGDESYSSSDSQDFGFGLDLGSMIDSMTDSFSNSDSTSFG